MFKIREKVQYLLINFQKYCKPVLLTIFVLNFSFPQPVLAQEAINYNLAPVPEQSLRNYYAGPTLPEIPARAPRQTMYLMVTAYNSEPGQTDDTPFITAFGTHVRDGIVAANFLPKGTIVRFPEVFGDKEFVVEDRMNQRYYYHLDIWMTEKAAAVNFGAKFLKVEIL